MGVVDLFSRSNSISLYNKNNLQVIDIRASGVIESTKAIDLEWSTDSTLPAAGVHYRTIFQDQDTVR